MDGALTKAEKLIANPAGSGGLLTRSPIDIVCGK